MRTKVTRKHAVIEVPTTVNYQFDDTITPDKPHIYEWAGIAATGTSKAKALEQLGIEVARFFSVRMMDKGWSKEQPTEPGWYWWRDLDEMGFIGPMCVCVFQHHLKQELWGQCMEDKGAPLSEWPGEWWAEQVIPPDHFPGHKGAYIGQVPS